jgi:hypothetical protein
MTTKPRYVRTPRFTRSEWHEVRETIRGVILGHSLNTEAASIEEQIKGIHVGGYLEPNRAMIRVIRKVLL